MRPPAPRPAPTAPLAVPKPVAALARAYSSGGGSSAGSSPAGSAGMGGGWSSTGGGKAAGGGGGGRKGKGVGYEDDKVGSYRQLGKQRQCYMLNTHCHASHAASMWPVHAAALLPASA